MGGKTLLNLLHIIFPVIISKAAKRVSETELARRSGKRASQSAEAFQATYQ